MGAGLQLGEKLSIGLRGQAGGFGLNNCSDENWWLIAGLNYRFSKRWSAKAEYRYWRIDYYNGSIGAYMTLHGPWLGTTYDF